MKKFVVLALIVMLSAVLLGIGIDTYKWVLIVPGICGLLLAVIYGVIAGILAIDNMVDDDFNK